MSTKVKPPYLKCSAVSEDTGKLCRLYAMHGTKFCFHHSPEFSEWRRTNALKAGKGHKSMVKKFEDFVVHDSTDIQKAVRIAIEHVLRKGIGSSAQANILQRLATTYAMLEKNVEIPQLLKQLKALEIELEEKLKT